MRSVLLSIAAAASSFSAVLAQSATIVNLGGQDGSDIGNNVGDISSAEIIGVGSDGTTFVLSGTVDANGGTANVATATYVQDASHFSLILSATESGDAFAVTEVCSHSSLDPTATGAFQDDCVEAGFFAEGSITTGLTTSFSETDSFIVLAVSTSSGFVTSSMPAGSASGSAPASTTSAKSGAGSTAVVVLGTFIIPLLSAFASQLL